VPPEMFTTAACAPAHKPAPVAANTATAQIAFANFTESPPKSQAPQVLSYCFIELRSR
jgi:hypothetical protein